MFCKSDIANLKTDISEVVGKKILVKGQKGRSKQYENENSSTSITYTDVFTGIVDVKVYDGEQYNPLISPTEDKRIRRFMF